MKKIFHSLFLVSCFLFLGAKSALALTLDTIGTSTVTGGNPGTDWYYTSNNPALAGTAAASSTVTVTINSIAYTATTNTSGSWTYIPTTLTAGDHTITIAGDATSIPFTMHIGQSAPTGGATTTTTSTPSAQTLPVSGATETTLMLLGLGIITILSGLYINSKTPIS